MWPFEGGASFVDLFCYLFFILCWFWWYFCSFYACVHLLRKCRPLGSPVCGVFLSLFHMVIGVWGQVWFLIVLIPDLWLLTLLYNVCNQGIRLRITDKELILFIFWSFKNIGVWQKAYYMKHKKVRLSSRHFSVSNTRLLKQWSSKINPFCSYCSFIENKE